MKKEEKKDMFETLSTEEKLNNLNTRLIKLEKIEHRRKIMGWIDFGFKILGIIILIIIFIKAYKFVKTYKEQLDKVQSVQEKLDATNGFLDEQLKNLDKYINFD